jgi:hypothetical protein
LANFSKQLSIIDFNIATVLVLPFYGIVLAPLYLLLVGLKLGLVMILNPKLEEVELCIIE